MPDATRTRRRAQRPAGPPDVAPVCRCRQLVLGKLVAGGQPVLVVTFAAPRLGADAQVVAVEYRHWAGRDGCRMPAEQLDPTTWGRAVTLQPRRRLRFWWHRLTVDWFARLVPYRFRRVHQWYAHRFGYFWKACPLCDLPFGGHEWRDIRGLPPEIPDPTRPPRDLDGGAFIVRISGGIGICPTCTRAGRGRR